MTTRRLQPSQAAALGTLALVAALHAGRPAPAQSMLGFDPYRPYSSGYESVALPPSAAMNFDAINAARAGSYSTRANQMSSFYDELYGPGTGLGGQADKQRRLMRPGVSYSSADRQYDKDWGRVYTPNKDDAKFYEDKQKRDEEYFKEYEAARKERDPKKRRERLRALEQQTLAQSRLRAREASSLPRTAPGTRKPGTAAGTSGSTSTGTRPAARTYSSRLTPGGSTGSTTTAPRTTTRRAPTTAPRFVLPGSATGTGTGTSRTAPATGGTRSALPPASSPGSAPSATRSPSPSEVLNRALRTEPPPRTPSTTSGGSGSSTQPPR